MTTNEWPGFLIGGAPRAATTSLAEALNKHADIFIPEVKEIDFFHRDDNWEKGDSWYLNHFSKDGNAVIQGEATPYYLCSPDACMRIKDKMPHAKLIFILRNPVKRAWSHYCFRKLDGREKRPFRAVIEAYNSGNRYSNYTPMSRPDYPIYLSLYYEGIHRFMSQFDSRQILIVLMEELINKPAVILNQIQKFLGLEIKKLSFEKKNACRKPLINFYNQFFIYGTKKRYYLSGILNKIFGEAKSKHLMNLLVEINMVKANKPKLKPFYTEQLYNIFEPDIIKLSDLLEKDLSVWAD